MESPLKRLLARSDKLDERLRFYDFYAHRTFGGWLNGLCQINRHTLSALILPCLVCGLMVLASPSMFRFLMSLISIALVGVILAWFMKRSALKTWPVQVDLVAQSMMVLLIATLIWIVGDNEYQEHGLYKHVFVVVAALLAITFLVAAALIGWMFKRIQRQNLKPNGQTNYGDYLQKTELFASRGAAPDVTVGTILSSSVTILLRSPLALLTVPAIVALVSPTAYVWQLALLALAICFLGLIFAAVNERFGAMWTLLQAAFFRGGALLVSLVVIALGIARLLGSTYVTPIFDTAAWHTLGITFASVYILSWWYDYWSNRLLVDRIMAMLNPSAAGMARIPYNICRCHAATHVPEDSRFLQVHGSGRVLAIRENTTIRDKNGKIVYEGPVFQAQPLADLIKLLALSGAPGGKEDPTMAQVQSRILNFHSVLALIFVLMNFGLWSHLSQGKQAPEVRVRQSAVFLPIDRPDTTDVHCLNGEVEAENTETPVAPPGYTAKTLTDLLNQSSGSPDRTLIVIAGSGGGTRAALYTASILEGISSLGKGNDVVLASGVSGGGAALAYFAANRDRLISSEGKANQGEWNLYFEAMRQSYIQDVLDRATEWRMAGSGRLGQLLDCSFREHWKLRSDHNKLSHVTQMGLIFNTTLAGHVEDVNGNQQVELSEIEPSLRDNTKSTLAGGRLILTNLKLSNLAEKPLEPPDPINPLPELPVIISDPNLRLEDAAALNANFPPVFSNAGIDVDRRTRYWVTDGGAADNRGMEMMLYALFRALCDKNLKALPRLLIVVADASAFSDKYSQNRGISSLAGAGSHYASHLDADLYARIANLYVGQTEKLHFAYVMMPDHLRESGSFGTHWMLQKWIRIRGPEYEVTCEASAGPKPEVPHQKPESVTISGDQMIQVLRALHDPDQGKKLPSDEGKVLDWSQKDCGHKNGWNTVINTLVANGPAESSEAPKNPSHTQVPP